MATTAASYPAWETALLQQLGVQPRPTSLEALDLWWKSEGTPTNGYNWLAISDPSNQYPHAGVLAGNGGNPIYAFPSQQIGVEATANFLEHGYGNVVAALQTGSLTDIFSAINQSGWCRGCQGGRYPVAMANALGGGAGAIYQGAPSTAGSSSSSSSTGDLSGCVLGWNGVFGLGSFCLLKRSQVKALLGGLLVGSGGLLMLTGGILLAQAGLSGTKAGRAIEQTAAKVGPAPLKAASAVRKAAGQANTQAKARHAERSAAANERDGVNARAEQRRREHRRGRSSPGPGRPSSGRRSSSSGTKERIRSTTARRSPSRRSHPEDNSPAVTVYDDAGAF